MANHTDLETLRSWLTAHGGRLSSDISICRDDQSGVHCRASTSLASGSTLCTVPHALSLSSLNALVDDDFTAFKSRGLAVEAIGHFYLMHQYLVKDRSFWKPYLLSLPSPDVGHSTPFWFDDEDLAWLAETDVYHTTLARKALHQRNYDVGIQLLKRANVDASLYTWHLYLWAVTMFTSRSFSSRALRPESNKYWAAYKTGSEGRRQTVLIDMSREPAENLDFPVLFPVIDIPNHRHDAKVDWSFEGGRFGIALAESIDTPGAEVFNNYGPKGNDELLLGYGFCLPNNPNDKVLLTMKAPPQDLQELVRPYQPGYFGLDHAWSSEKATFGLKKCNPGSTAEAFFRNFPEPMLELLLYILRHERGLPFEFIEHPLRYITASEGHGHRYLPHLARAVVQSLGPKLQRIQASSPASLPTNHKQAQAAIYREGQIGILQSIIDGCKQFFSSFHLTSTSTAPLTGGRLYSFEDLLRIADHTPGRALGSEFLSGVVLSAGTEDVNELRQAGWEEDLFALLLCFLALGGWKEASGPEYPNHNSVVDGLSDVTDALELEQASSLFDIVEPAAQALPDTLWGDKRWSLKLIASYGGRMLKYESFTAMRPSSMNGELVPTLMIYLDSYSQ